VEPLTPKKDTFSKGSPIRGGLGTISNGVCRQH
jgi:hypothetical protein